MNYRRFGQTDLMVSEVGFGAWAIGGPAMAGDIPIGWGDVDDRVSIKALKTSFDRGINFYDTADFYGLGHSEELIGKLWGNRDDVIVASKVGHRLGLNQQIYLDYSKNYILEACERSLSRLKRDTIDFYQLHAAKLDHLQDGECVEAMEQLQKDGKIRYWGISLNTFDPDPEANFMIDGNLGNGFQLVFNIINQKAIQILVRAKDAGMGVIARMPFQFGLLTGKFDKNSHFAKSDHRSFRLSPQVLERSLTSLEAVWPIAEKYNTKKDSLALSFILSHAEISTAIPGIRTPEQAIANTMDIFVLPQNDLDALHRMYGDRFEDLLDYIKVHG